MKPCVAITEYWLAHYTNKNLCSLCGNSGVIDTTGHAISAAGVDAGRKNYCICPNGQAMRALGHISGVVVRIGGDSAN